MTGEVGLAAAGPHPSDASRVAEFLGIDAALGALRAIEAGSRCRRQAEPSSTVGDDWDVAERPRRRSPGSGCRPTSSSAASASSPAARWCSSAWHGCCSTVPTCCCSTSRPTTSTRRPASGCYDVVEAWSGTLLVVSHDRELLEHVDRIGDLREGAVRWYGGGYTAYAEQVAAEQEAAEQAVTTARSAVRRQQADRAEAERLLAQRKRQGARNAARTNMGKGAQDFWKNRSEKHGGEVPPRARRAARGRARPPRGRRGAGARGP